ncbi:MAG: hypothetical protein NTV05_04895 [Acidobacteria bacterium]|nr:hypothetical protein [Acidobacteriota bacterium]
MRVVSRVIVIAYFLDVGVLLTLAPWSALWEHNYFILAWPAVAVVAGNDYVRGAISGLGLINLGAACAEVVGLIRRGAGPGHPVV